MCVDTEEPIQRTFKTAVHIPVPNHSLPQLLQLSRHRALICPECPRAHLLIKHLVQFLEGPALGLRDLKMDGDQRNGAHACKNPPDLAAQVRFVGVVEVRNRHVPHRREKVIESKTDRH